MSDALISQVPHEHTKKIQTKKERFGEFQLPFPLTLLGIKNKNFSIVGIAWCARSGNLFKLTPFFKSMNLSVKCFKNDRPHCS